MFDATCCKHLLFRTSHPTLNMIAYIHTQVLNHVPVVNFNFRDKVIYICHIVRRILKTVRDPSLLDDKDYYGNKRLELAGSLLSLLFEDLFKRFNTDLSRQINLILSKPNRATGFDVMKFMRTDTLTQGFVHAISTGNWCVTITTAASSSYAQLKNTSQHICSHVPC